MECLMMNDDDYDGDDVGHAGVDDRDVGGDDDV